MSTAEVDPPESSMAPPATTTRSQLPTQFDWARPSPAAVRVRGTLMVLPNAVQVFVPNE
jgi:hypothetical protein